jgi:hypothetical protein
MVVPSFANETSGSNDGGAAADATMEIPWSISADIMESVWFWTLAPEGRPSRRSER